MKTFFLSLAIFFLMAAGIGHSQPPTPPPVPTPAPSPVQLVISGPKTFPEHTLAQYTVPGANGVGWLVLPVGSGSTVIISSSNTLVFTAPPGSYQILAATSQNGNIIFLTLAVTVTPDSSTNKPLAIAVFDPSTLTSLPAGQAAIYTSTTISSSLSAQGVTWLQYSVGDVVPTLKGGSPFISTRWGTLAQSAGLPALVLSNNGTVSAGPLPQTEAAIITKVLSAR